jgi:hypothetical protein
VGLYWRDEREFPHWPPKIVITADSECPNCHRPSNVAHVGFEVAAITMAEPLRRAFDQHLDAHGCAERLGFAYCDEAMRLFRLLPIGERAIVA